MEFYDTYGGPGRSCAGPHVSFFSLLLLIGVLWGLQATAQNTSGQNLLWQLELPSDPAAGGAITLPVSTLTGSYQDHLEMSGKYLAAIIHYGVDSNRQLILQRQLIFPRLRIIPNNTYGQLKADFNGPVLPGITIQGQPLQLQVTAFKIRGHLGFTATAQAGLVVTARLFPSMDKPAFIENYRLRNSSNQPLVLQCNGLEDSLRITDSAKGVYGAYKLRRQYFPENQLKGKELTLAPGASLALSLVTDGRTIQQQPYTYDGDYEWQKRARYLKEIHQSLVLKTPNDTINQMFDFAKIRASESIFDTRGGLMHGPGGGVYYAAIWANDQAEYVSPFFPFLGYAEGNASAVNCFRLFARYMNPDYKPLPSSIIAEGTDVWQGAGDRGDQAMIAYGASRFALAFADTVEARRCWPLITWCLNYLETRKLKQGVIASNSDELEGRFPTGQANLSTNALAYGALISAAHLATELGFSDSAFVYNRRADQLASAIDAYFGSTIDGFRTYRYYKGNTRLRSWICLPLVMGLMDRKEGTAAALLSEQLWSKNGILTEARDSTYWDRGTLYAFRGLFNAGQTDRCYPYFSYYSAMRLLGTHVPYAIEAWPEGNQRQLSAESGLYLRAVTEGLFGLQPTGFNRFTLMPYLPKGWDLMSLEHIKAFRSSDHGQQDDVDGPNIYDQDFSIRVERVVADPAQREEEAGAGAGAAAKPRSNFQTTAKTKITIYNQHGILLTGYWDGHKPFEVTL